MKRTMWLPMAAVLAAATFAPAAPAQEGETQDQITQQIDRAMERLTRDLGLSDGQAEKIRAILVETMPKRDAVDKDQAARIGEVLTPEQKTTYDRSRERGGRGERGERGAFGRGMLSGFTDQMKTELGLNEEQQKKVEEILTQAQTEMGDSFRRMREEGMGNQDWDSIRQRMTEMWDGVSSKIEGVLDESQKEKYRTLVEELRNRNPMFRGEGPGRGPATEPGRPEFGRDARRTERALEALKLPEEDAAILKPMLEAIEQARQDRAAVDEARRTLQATLDAGGAENATIEAQLAALREAQAAHDAAVKAKRKELDGLLSAEQEARLVTMGILE